MKYAPGEHYRLYGKRCYEKNKDKYKPVRRRYAETHRADAVKRVQAYVKRHPDRVAAYNHAFGQSVAGRYRLILHRHKKRGWEGEPLSLEQYAQLSALPCSYCGGSSNGGLDRVENNKGYTIENSTPCCKPCNYMKRDAALSSFLEHIKRIHSHMYGN